MPSLIRSVLVAIAVLASIPGARAEPLTVLAAASMRDAMNEIGTAFTAETGRDVRFSFAASSALARQIAAGAPADIYVSASSGWMDYLETENRIAAGTRRTIAGNRLVIIAPSGALRGQISGAAPDFDALLGERGRLAIGDPDHVPAGIYARQALEAWGVWDAVEPRLARADDVRAAVTLVARGETPLGISYATDAALLEQVSVVAVIPDNLHDAIVYPAGVVAGHEEAGQPFMNFLGSEAAQAILQRFGFSVE
ncbi:molybdate ABC transporter substrate-binding protein [Tepidamorphus sp. 3E244]|uniref:molybdate ABC transporter substrate-binding protein n=1 Tax=Tepidamorphus sp. 3E244 TaxID=3385498 RepID=UPI0038FCF94D